MHQQRFQNRQPRRIFQFKGYFSLTYMGNGTFYYKIHGREYPHIGKIELGHKRYRRRYLGAMTLFGSLFLGIMSLLPDTAGGDVPITNFSELKQLEQEGRYEELDQKSEEAKSRLYSLNDEVRAGRVKVKEYTVRFGDTLSEIATKHRVPLSMIAASSKVKEYDMIKPGQKLLIPERPGLIYRLRKGDTLAAVLHKYSVKLEDVVEENPNLEDFDIIEPGVNIFLPNAKIPRPPVTWSSPLRSRVTSRFGWRRHPIYRRRHFHTGIDLAAVSRSVHNVRTGKVIYAGYLGAYGKVVVVRHNASFKSLYAHLSKIYVKPGSYVKRGKVIGISGNTGRSTGPHLHFELIRNGRPINPRRYIRF